MGCDAIMGNEESLLEIELTSIFNRNIGLVENRDFGALVDAIAGSLSQTAYFCNVHMIMLSQEDEDLARAMDKADIVFADGVPVAWLQRKLTGRDAKVVRGYEMMLAVCEHAALNDEKVGFLGSTEDVIDGLVSNLSAKCHGLKIGYRYCPSFQKNEVIFSSKELADLKDSPIKWLFVGLGCPKQEKWIARYKNEIGCNVLGVGAAFDWLSGVTRKPPAWMEKYALGWLFRLAINPRKMWRRYLIYNTKFLFKVPGELYRNDRTRKQKAKH